MTSSEINLPALPQPVFEYSEEQRKIFGCLSESKSQEEIISHKLSLLWGLYNALVNNADLVKAIEKPAKVNSTKRTLQDALVQTVDLLGKILGEDIFQNIQYLNK